MAEQEKYITGIPKSKSRNFLWPLVGFKKDAAFTPAGVYCYWDGDEIETVDNGCLIAYYKESGDAFKSFEEKEILTKDDCLQTCYKVENGTIYIFNIAEWIKDIYQFLDGKYSKFSREAKDVIMKYHGIKDNKVAEPGRPIYMSLYPEIFHKAVAKELNMEVENIREVYELCEKYKVEDETLKIYNREDCECVEKISLYL